MVLNWIKTCSWYQKGWEPLAQVIKQYTILLFFVTGRKQFSLNEWTRVERREKKTKWNHSPLKSSIKIQLLIIKVTSTSTSEAAIIFMDYCWLTLCYLLLLRTRLDGLKIKNRRKKSILSSLEIRRSKSYF